MAVFQQLKESTSAAKALRVKSALNPLLWLTGVCGTLCLGGAWLFRAYPWIAGFLVAGFLATLGVNLWAAIYFVVKDPSRLQSEDYQLRDQAMRLLQVHMTLAPGDAATLAAITATAAAQLGPGNEDNPHG